MHVHMCTCAPACLLLFPVCGSRCVCVRAYSCACVRLCMFVCVCACVRVGGWGHTAEGLAACVHIRHVLGRPCEAMRAGKAVRAPQQLVWYGLPQKQYNCWERIQTIPCMLQPTCISMRRHAPHQSHTHNITCCDGDWYAVQHRAFRLAAACTIAVRITVARRHTATAITAHCCSRIPSPCCSSPHHQRLQVHTCIDCAQAPPPSQHAMHAP